MSRLEQYEQVRLRREERVAWLTLARPEKLNALNRATLDELGLIFERLGGETDLRAVVITGAGDKAFAAGADIGELAELGPLEGLEASRRGSAVMRKIERSPVPVIAAINGYALGGGLELALACTLRIASETARLGQPEVKLGLIPGYGGTQRLARLIGPGAALHLILSGEPVSAAEALRLGLVSQLTPAAGLEAAARALAQTIAAHAPRAVQLALQAARAAADLEMEQGLALESSLFALSCATQDMKEGTRAFLEKRAPRFQGR